MDRKRKREKTKAATPAFKRKRRDKKGSRVRSVRSKEIREGDSYRSAISSTEKESPDIEEIPAPTAENDDITLHLGNTSTVFFDLETTGLDTQNRESIDNTSSATENVNTNLLVVAFNAMSQCVNGLQKSVDTLMTEKLYDNSKPYNLHQWYNSSNTAPSLQNTPDALHHGLNRTGVRSDDFPNVDIVSTGLQKQIIQGRRLELDAYEEDIIENSDFYGHEFYDYHKLFSAKASTLVHEKQIKVDWGKRDRDLMILIGAGVEINICKLCHMVDHDSKFCPLQFPEKSVSTPHPTKIAEILIFVVGSVFITTGQKFAIISIACLAVLKTVDAFSYTCASIVATMIIVVTACHRQSTHNDSEKNRKNHSC
ncbi:unnamed protein product [Mytilus edulis]|uniref:Exonuclease domain-containing protein n=1 Tax=Mytilus edulis TaxID=6550 RepID=A0A8S3SZI0_MYTED|nr:unnamed protein product [Mytilus edulis]